MTVRSLALAIALAALPLAAAGPATAAVTPGSNGRIAFVSERDGNREIYVMNADAPGRRG